MPGTVTYLLLLLLKIQVKDWDIKLVVKLSNVI